MTVKSNDTIVIAALVIVFEPMGSITYTNHTFYIVCLKLFFVLFFGGGGEGVKLLGILIGLSCCCSSWCDWLGNDFDTAWCFDSHLKATLC